MVRIHFDTTTAAFTDAPGTEIARILRTIAERIEQDPPAYALIFDMNGNRIGEVQITHEGDD